MSDSGQEMVRILIVDDNATTRFFIRQALPAAEFETYEASDGVAGLSSLQRTPVDLILCDLVMPGQGGMIAIPAMRAAFPAIPIIAMSGGVVSAPDDLLAAARRLGAAASLAKPFASHALIALVRRVLAERAASS